MADMEARSEAVRHIFTNTTYDYAEHPDIVVESLEGDASTLNVTVDESKNATFFTTATLGGPVESAEPTNIGIVQAVPKDATMTIPGLSPGLSKADWRKLAIAGAGSAAIGAGALLSPLVPIAAIAIAAVAVTVAAVRGASR